MKFRASDDFWKVDKKQDNTPIEPLPDIVDPRITAAVEAAREALGFEYCITVSEDGAHFVHLGLASQGRTAYHKVYDKFVGRYCIENYVSDYVFVPDRVRIEWIPENPRELEEVVVNWVHLPSEFHRMVKSRIEEIEGTTRVCEECGAEYESPELPGRPPDRPPLACSIGCREKLLKKTGRKVG